VCEKTSRRNKFKLSFYLFVPYSLVPEGLHLPTNAEKGESTLHDYPIYEICAIAESLGYKIVERHLGGEQGPDIVIKNPVNNESIIVESEVGHNITSQSYHKFEREAKTLTNSLKAVIVITETPRRVWRKPLKGIERRKNFFVVAGSVFKDVMPALLVKLLG